MLLERRAHGQRSGTGMNTSESMPTQHCLLLDGALFSAVCDLPRLVKEAQATALYTDLGEDAALVGPLLLSAAHAHLLPLTVADSISAKRAQRFGTAELAADVPMVRIAEHLRRIRHLHTADGQQFFLRCADSRGLRCLWDVLLPQQREALLGPILEWRIRGENDAPRVLRRDLHKTTRAALPLVLNDEALSRFTELALPWQLMIAAEEAHASLVQFADDERLAFTRQAVAWADRSEHDVGFALQTALVAAFTMTQGFAFRHEGFSTAWSESSRSNDPQPLYRWLGETFAEEGLGA
jgi:hypothetical protein